MMPWWVAGVLALGILAAALSAWACLRLAARLADLEARREQPDQAVLLLQREIEAARVQGQQGMAETIASVRQELTQFAGQMTAQMGQVGAGVQQQLQHVTRAVTDVQGSLGKLGEANQRIYEVGRSIAGLEQILKSPKIRGLVAETDETARKQWRRAFVRDVKSRVDEIAKKYILPDEGTYDFALMYIPAENVYFEAIVRDESIDEDAPAVYATSRRVIPVSPNSLYAYLRVIVLGLKGLQIERSAQEIQARLARLGGDLDRFREAFDVVGRHLTNARNKYDEASNALNRVEAKLEGIEKHGGQDALPGVGP